MTVVTRFAPSPTGFLHIGGARTALFNWLFARHHDGQFRLRVEDTDQDRSTLEAVKAILEGLQWLELDWDGEPIFQSEQRKNHIAVANKLLMDGKAYYCYSSPEELDEMRTLARAEGSPLRYDGRWRDRDPADAPLDILPVIRFKAPLDGHTVIADAVQGEVCIPNSQLDDMILVRSDGTPTYMLSSVVDDHDMKISHVIRGADHLTNAARQANLYTALEWHLPVFAHIPLIHGSDGSRLSKRHGALGVSAYQDMGYLPSALKNYLTRLGWSHGNDEIFTTEQAISWFELSQVGRSSARFDLAKLTATNTHYIRTADNEYLITLMIPILEKDLGRIMEDRDKSSLNKILPELKIRSSTLLELTDNASFYLYDGFPKIDPKASKLLDCNSLTLLERVAEYLENVETWDDSVLEACVRTIAEEEGVKMGQIAQPMRAAITGRTVSPPIFSVMSVIGRKTTINRLKAVHSRKK